MTTRTRWIFQKNEKRLPSKSPENYQVRTICPKSTANVSSWNKDTEQLDYSISKAFVCVQSSQVHANNQPCRIHI